VTGYHRLTEAALYRRNGRFGNINPFPEEEEEEEVVNQWKEKERRQNEDEEVRSYPTEDWDGRVLVTSLRAMAENSLSTSIFYVSISIMTLNSSEELIYCFIYL